MAIASVFKPYFDVLGFQPTTDKDAIRKAYKQKSMPLHPDKKGRRGEAAFKMIVHACEVLCEHQLRPEDIEDAECGDTGSGSVSTPNLSADTQEISRERDSLRKVVAQQAITV